MAFIIGKNKYSKVFFIAELPVNGEKQRWKNLGILLLRDLQKPDLDYSRNKGNKVMVWSEKVPKPVAVCYGWADNPEGANFFSKDGLPA